MALAHDPDGKFDTEALVAKARAFAGLEGLDLAKEVTCAQSYRWDEMRWAWPEGYSRQTAPSTRSWPWITARNATSCAALPRPVVT